MEIKATTDLSQFDELMRQFPKEVRAAAVDTLNETTITANAEGIKMVKEDYLVKTSPLKRRQSVKRARADELFTVTTWAGTQIALRNFKTSKTRKGIRARVRKDGSGAVIPATFDATSRKGSRHIWQRVPKDSLGPGQIGKAKKRGWTGGRAAEMDEAVDDSGFVGRFPIRPLFGPSLPQMIQKEFIDGVFKFTVKRLFGIRFNRRLQYRLGRIKGKG